PRKIRIRPTAAQRSRDWKGKRSAREGSRENSCSATMRPSKILTRRCKRCPGHGSPGLRTWILAGQSLPTDRDGLVASSRLRLDLCATGHCVSRVGGKEFCRLLDNPLCVARENFRRHLHTKLLPQGEQRTVHLVRLRPVDGLRLGAQFGEA